MKSKTEYFFIAIVLIAVASAVQGQTLDNYRTALSILSKSQSVMGTSTRAVLIFAKGTIRNLGHYETPEKTKDLPLRDTYGFFSEESAHYLYSELQSRGRTYQRVAISTSDSLYQLGYFDKSNTAGISSDFTFEAAKALPFQLLRLAYAKRNSLRYLGEQPLGKSLLRNYLITK